MEDIINHNINNDLKFCKKCFSIKNVECFGKDKSKKTGLYSYCKDCTKINNQKIRNNQKIKKENLEKNNNI